MNGKKLKLKKPPVIRPGNVRPYKRCTEAEREERIEYVAQLITQQLTRYQIHKAMLAKYDVAWNVVDSIYITRARKLLATRVKMSREQARDFGVGKLLEVARTGTNKEVTMAVKVLMEICGGFAPRQTEVTGANGTPLAVAITDETVSPERLRQLITEDVTVLGITKETVGQLN
jgi:hypothetical protein